MINRLVGEPARYAVLWAWAVLLGLALAVTIAAPTLAWANLGAWLAAATAGVVHFLQRAASAVALRRRRAQVNRPW